MNETQRKYINEESKFINVVCGSHQCRLHYRDEGRGPVLLLLHGVCASLHTWDAWVGELKSSFRVIRMDVPGFGFSSPPAEGHYDTEIVLAILTQFVEELGLDRFFLAGNSIGGLIAWKYAFKYPHMVQKLILIDPVGHNQDLPWIVNFASNPFVRPVARRIMPRFFFNMAARQIFGDPGRLTAQISDRYFELSTSGGNRKAYVDFFTVMRKLCHSEELPRGMSGITTPLMVMWGTEDRWVPMSHFDLWKQHFPEGTFKSYEGVGHTPMEEIPTQTADDARAFMMRK